jgi:catechol 2,3-dioxygenase-like lactoylglutathione lyase family enzyme
MITGIDHVQLAMPKGRESEARNFYGLLLGLSEVQKPAGLAGRGGCWFGGPATMIHLGVEPDFRAARKAHPALLTDDIGELSKRLLAHGFEVEFDLALPGTQRFFTHDPFGNRLEFIQSGDH